jgi:excisionase family DNA binding protein
MTRAAAGSKGRRHIAPLLTVSEAAEALNVCTKTVYRHISAGRLKAVRAGRLWRIPLASLEEFLRQSDTSSEVLIRP